MKHLFLFLSIIFHKHVLLLSLYFSFVQPPVGATLIVHSSSRALEMELEYNCHKYLSILLKHSDEARANANARAQSAGAKVFPSQLKCNKLYIAHTRSIHTSCLFMLVGRGHSISAILCESISVYGGQESAWAHSSAMSALYRVCCRPATLIRIYHQR